MNSTARAAIINIEKNEANKGQDEWWKRNSHSLSLGTSLVGIIVECSSEIVSKNYNKQELDQKEKESSSQAEDFPD